MTTLFYLVNSNRFQVTELTRLPISISFKMTIWKDDRSGRLIPQHILCVTRFFYLCFYDDNPSWPLTPWCAIKIIDFYIWSNSYKYVWFLSDLSEFFSLKLNGKIGWDPSTESRLPAARSWPCARCNAPQLYLKLRSVFGIPSVVVIAGGRGSPPYLSAPAHITHTGEGRHPPLPYNIIIWEFIINKLFLWLMTFLMILFWILWMLVEVSL